MSRLHFFLFSPNTSRWENSLEAAREAISSTSLLSLPRSRGLKNKAVVVTWGSRSSLGS